MATTTQYTCDHCRQVKGEANHWFCLAIDVQRLQVYTWAAGHQVPGVLHLCGEECLHAEVSSAIAAGQGRQIFLRRPAVEQVVTESGVRAA